MASKRLPKGHTGNTLAGWSEVIRETGVQSQNAEEERKASASILREELRALEPLDRAKALIQAHDERRINLRELMFDLRDTVGLPPGDDKC